MGIDSFAPVQRGQDATIQPSGGPAAELGSGAPDGRKLIVFLGRPAGRHRNRNFLIKAGGGLAPAVRHGHGVPPQEEAPSTDQSQAPYHRSVVLGNASYIDLQSGVRLGASLPVQTAPHVFLRASARISSRDFQGPRTPAVLLPWKVFEAVDLFSMAVPVLYEKKIESVASRWPSAWQLVVAADEMRRAGHIERGWRSQGVRRIAGKDVPLDYFEQKPWSGYFRLSSEDTAFWDVLHSGRRRGWRLAFQVHGWRRTRKWSRCFYRALRRRSSFGLGRTDESSARRPSSGSGAGLQQLQVWKPARTDTGGSGKSSPGKSRARATTSRRASRTWTRRHATARRSATIGTTSRASSQTWLRAYRAHRAGRMAARRASTTDTAYRSARGRTVGTPLLKQEELSISVGSSGVTWLSRAGFSAFTEVTAIDEPGNFDHHLRRFTWGSGARLSDTASACGLEALTMFLIVFLTVNVRKVKLVQKDLVFGKCVILLPPSPRRELLDKSVVTDSVAAEVGPKVRGVGEINVLTPRSNSTN